MSTFDDKPKNELDRLRDETACFVEHHVLPLIAAFALGVLLTLWGAEQQQAERLDGLQGDLRAARRDLRDTQRALGALDRACTPLLSLPPEAVPELVPDEPTQEAPALRTSWRHRPGAAAKVQP